MSIPKPTGMIVPFDPSAFEFLRKTTKKEKLGLYESVGIPVNPKKKQKCQNENSPSSSPEFCLYC